MSVPKLRFKDDKGREFPAWEAKRLSDISTLITKGTTPGTFAETGVNFIKIESLEGKTINADKCAFIDYSTHHNELKRSVLNEGDILFAIAGATIGKCGIVTVDILPANTNQALAIIRLRNNESHEYIYHILSSHKMRRYILDNISVGAQPNLNLEQMGNFSFHYPSLTEQTKIANFLTAVDEKISQLTQKCELLTQYKKGLMQQIFSQALRFKDDEGREFSAWEEKKLADIFTFIQTNSFSRELLSYESGAVKNIHYGDIHTKFKSNFKIENEVVPFINPDVDISRISEECYCKVGDLVIADASEDYADVGKAIEIISLGKEKLLSGLHTYIARDSSSQLALGFRGYLMQSEAARLQIKTLATGVSVLSISKGNLAKVKLNIPSMGEQTKIANFLTAIDNKINNAKTQLEAAKQYKQGLLQQMFV